MKKISVANSFCSCFSSTTTTGVRSRRPYFWKGISCWSCRLHESGRAGCMNLAAQAAWIGSEEHWSIANEWKFAACIRAMERQKVHLGTYGVKRIAVTYQEGKDYHKEDRCCSMISKSLRHVECEHQSYFNLWRYNCKATIHVRRSAFQQ